MREIARHRARIIIFMPRNSVVFLGSCAGSNILYADALYRQRSSKFCLHIWRHIRLIGQAVEAIREDTDDYRASPEMRGEAQASVIWHWARFSADSVGKVKPRLK